MVTGRSGERDRFEVERSALNTKGLFGAGEVADPRRGSGFGAGAGAGEARVRDEGSTRGRGPRQVARVRPGRQPEDKRDGRETVEPVGPAARSRRQAGAVVEADGVGTPGAPVEAEACLRVVEGEPVVVVPDSLKSLRPVVCRSGRRTARLTGDSGGLRRA